MYWVYLALFVVSGCSNSSTSGGTARNGTSSDPLMGHGMRFVRVQPMEFMMGNPADNGDSLDSARYHRVRITRPFQIQVTPMTQLTYFQLTNHNPSRFKDENHCPGEHQTVSGVDICPNHPVERVSWYDAQAVAHRLNEKNDGFFYRLPTEAEWEAAARGETDTHFFVGNLPIGKQAEDLGWYSANSNGRTQPVGTKAANPFGLFDVHGNVKQWVEDVYDDYPENVPIDIDPVVKSAGSTSEAGPEPQRVLRGCSWKSRSFIDECGSYYRTYTDPRFPQVLQEYRVLYAHGRYRMDAIIRSEDLAAFANSGGAYDEIFYGDDQGIRLVRTPL